MSEWWQRLKDRMGWLWETLSWVGQYERPIASRDRTLPGKARVKARRLDRATKENNR